MSVGCATAKCATPLSRVPPLRFCPDGCTLYGGTEPHQHVAAVAEGLLHQLFLSPLGDDLAMIDDGDRVAQALGLFHVVRGVNDGGAFVAQTLDHFEDAVAGLRIDAHGGLVEQDEARTMDEAGRHVEAAPHAAGERLDGVPARSASAAQSRHHSIPLRRSLPRKPW